MYSDITKHSWTSRGTIYEFFLINLFKPHWNSWMWFSDKEGKSKVSKQLCGDSATMARKFSEHIQVIAFPLLQGLTQGMMDPTACDSSLSIDFLDKKEWLLWKLTSFEVLCGFLSAWSQCITCIVQSQLYCCHANCKGQPTDRFSWQGKKHFMKPNTFLVTWNISKIFLINCSTINKSKSQCITHRSALKNQNHSTNERWSYW